MLHWPRHSGQNSAVSVLLRLPKDCRFSIACENLSVLLSLSRFSRFLAPSTLLFTILVIIRPFRVLCPEFWRSMRGEDCPEPHTAHLTDGICCACVQETPKACPAPAANCSRPGIPKAEKGKRRMSATRGLPRRSPILVVLLPKHL